jgi:hypothetical protein
MRDATKTQRPARRSNDGGGRPALNLADLELEPGLSEIELEPEADGDP